MATSSSLRRDSMEPRSRESASAVDYVDNILGCGQPGERVKRIGMDEKDWIPAPSLGIGARRILLAGNTKRILLIN